MYKQVHVMEQASKGTKGIRERELLSQGFYPYKILCAGSDHILLSSP